MTTLFSLMVSSILLAVCYGVVFSRVYPAISVDSGLVAVFAMLGVASSLLVSGLWRMISAIFRKKSAP